ncbi:MAG: hypothetical protein DWI03_08245 [Planctomycetota bacterium]|nr:MAG: hypothetical protein DWI03_08245 [Planctomycetota bacterium]
MAVGLCLASAALAADGMRVGVDGNYVLGMEREGRQWRWRGEARDLFQGIAAAGVEAFRVRLWTRNDGPNGRDEATEVVRRAVAAGLDPYLVIFLSDDWADLMKQPAPADWRDLDIDARAPAVRRYSSEVVAHFRRAGLRSHLYEIGNEIDYGICGVYPGKGTKKTPESLARRCWPEAARLIAASQAGVLEADPEATFMLHIAHWWDARFCSDFFRFMLDHGVQVDVAGLSYFPSANIGGSLQMEQFGEVAAHLHAAIQRPIAVPETAYPCTREFAGQFSRWKKETPGYPLTPDGQRLWLTDFLAFCQHHPAIQAVYYWSPEWYGEGMWTAFACFDVDGDARPAWESFAVPARGRVAAKRTTYMEAIEGSVATVPVAEARQVAEAVLREELRRHGGVTTGYIEAITARELVVAGYRVALRASLMGNLALNAAAKGSAAGDWRDAVNRMDGDKERLVLFVRRPDDPLVADVLAHAAARGVAVLTHPLLPEAPLTFGFKLLQDE